MQINDCPGVFWEGRAQPYVQPQEWMLKHSEVHLEKTKEKIDKIDLLPMKYVDTFLRLTFQQSKMLVLIEHAVPTKEKTYLGKPVQNTEDILSIIPSLNHRSI